MPIIRGIIAALVAVVVAVVGIVQMNRPIPPLEVVAATPARTTVAGQMPSLPWPQGAQAAMDVQGIGSLGSSGPQNPMPIGSVAKVMTAYLLLKAHPLSLYQNGPSVTITASEVAQYLKDASSEQSVVPVFTGERLTERQLLEGLMVASGNNVAAIVANWLAGSRSAFVTQMNAEARALGMTHTHYAGPSGLNPATVSTAADQIRLAEVAMKDPVFAEIAAMPQMSLPGVGVIYNYDYAVGHDGIIGVKTGSTVQAGGCFVFAAPRTVAGHTVTLYGAILGEQGTATQSQLVATLRSAEALLNAATPVLTPVTVAAAGQTGATVTAAWGPRVPAVMTRGVTVVGWPGLPIRYRVEPRVVKAPVTAGQSVGRLLVSVGSQTVPVPLAARGAIANPSLQWRLTRL